MNYLQQILGAFMTHFELILTITVLVCFVFYLIDGHSYRKAGVAYRANTKKPSTARKTNSRTASHSAAANSTG